MILNWKETTEKLERKQIHRSGYVDLEIIHHEWNPVCGVMIALHQRNTPVSHSWFYCEAWQIHEGDCKNTVNGWHSNTDQLLGKRDKKKKNVSGKGKSHPLIRYTHTHTHTKRERERESVCVYFVTLPAPVTQAEWLQASGYTRGTAPRWNTLWLDFKGDGLGVVWSVGKCFKNEQTAGSFSKRWKGRSKWTQSFPKWDPVTFWRETAGRGRHEGGTREEGDPAPRDLHHHRHHHRSWDLHLSKGHPEALG